MERGPVKLDYRRADPPPQPPGVRTVKGPLVVLALVVLIVIMMVLMVLVLLTL